MLFKSFPPEIKRVIRLAFLWTLFILLILNPFNDPFINSVANQEFFSFHAQDILGLSSKSNSDEEIYLATGTYEQQIDGDLFGIAKGRNLIVIQVESLQNSVIQAEYNGYEITPCLNALISDGSIYFDNFYQQLGSGNTSDAEFAMNNSMLGAIESYTYDLYQNNYFRGLPWILKQHGYSTVVLHGYHKDFWNRENAYPNQGFDDFIGGEQFENDYLVGIGNVQGVSDKEFFRQSVPYLKELDKPFYSFYVTLSSHHPFNMPEQLEVIPIRTEDRNTIFGNYINSIGFADSSIGEFIALLKENDLYDNSMIVIYGDHFALSQADEEVKASVSNYLGYDYDISEMMSVPLIISIPGENVKRTVSISGGETDILPTVAYLLGIEQLDTLYFGRNLLTAESGFVPQQTHLLKGSFIKDNIIFEMSRDGVFENSRAWDRFTKEPVDIEPLREYYLDAKRQVEVSQFYLRHDVLRKVLLEGKTIGQISGSEDNSIELTEEIGIAGAPSMELAGVNNAEALDTTYASGYRYIMAEIGTDHRNGCMPYKELAVWMKKHQDAIILADSRHQLLDIVKLLRSECPEVTDRIIPVVRSLKDYTMVEYAGYDNILVMPDMSVYESSEITDFLSLNKVWAVAVPVGQIANGYSNYMQGSTYIFAYDVDDIEYKALLRLAGADGFISRSRIFPLLQSER